MRIRFSHIALSAAGQRTVGVAFCWHFSSAATGSEDYEQQGGVVTRITPPAPKGQAQAAR
jgi:hypothetical protein